MFSPRLFYPTWLNHNFWWLHPLELKLHQSTDLGLLNRFPAFQLLSTPRKRKPSAAKKIVWSSFLIIIKRFARAAGARFFCFFFGGVLDGRALVTNGVNNYISRVWNLEKSMPTYRTGLPEGGGGAKSSPNLKSSPSLIYFCETGIRKNPFGFVFPYVLIHPAACATKMDRPRRLKNKWDSFLICGV